jgi:hypothetical protein
LFEKTKEKEMSMKDDYMISMDNTVYNIDKDISVEIFIPNEYSCYVSVYIDRNDSCVAFQTTRDNLKGLADFIYKTIGDR